MIDFLLHGLRTRPHIDRAIREASARTGIILGLLSGLSVVIVLWAIVLGVATVVGFGSGSPSGNFTAVLTSTWPLAPVLTAAAALAAPARRYFLGLHPAWGQIGAGLAVLTVFLLLALPWAFRQRLIQGDALTRQPAYVTPGSLYRATATDGWLFFWFGLLVLIAAIFFTVAVRHVFDYLLTRFRNVSEPEVEVASPTASDFQREQTGLGRLKVEIAELRARPVQRMRVDPIISSTNIIDREIGRAVPRWMEPLARLNFGPGKTLLIGFIVAAVVWFAAVAAKAPEDWTVWRAATYVTPQSTTLLVPFDLSPRTSAIRVYAVSGEGDVIAGVAHRGAPGPIYDRIIRVRGDRAYLLAGSSPPTVISLAGLEPGSYELQLNWFSGAVLVGIAAERSSAISTHFLAVILGISAAGMLAAGSGLVALALANLRAYFDF